MLFWKTKLICTATERLEVLGDTNLTLEHLRLSRLRNLVVNGDLKYPIVKNNSVQIKGEKLQKNEKAELTTFQSSYKIMKNSLLF